MTNAALPIALASITLCVGTACRPRTEAGAAVSLGAARVEGEPGIPLGAKPGDVTLLDVAGQPVTLASLHARRPVIVTFYRGGWCPFCTRALADWRERLGEVEAAGGAFVAITPERPERAVATREKIAAGAGYEVLSDHTMAAARAFNVAFRMDGATQTKYRGYGIDLAKHNAVGEWDLPAPATFILDRQGRVRYVFASWDYTKRANPDEVIAALRALRE
jgi:peroxiredoxin